MPDERHALSSELDWLIAAERLSARIDELLACVDYDRKGPLPQDVAGRIRTFDQILHHGLV